MSSSGRCRQNQNSILACGELKWVVQILPHASILVHVRAPESDDLSWREPVFWARARPRAHVQQGKGSMTDTVLPYKAFPRDPHRPFRNGTASVRGQLAETALLDFCPSPASPALIDRWAPCSGRR